jgi:hypothetical protein
MSYKITSNFHAYRGTSTANQNILDLSVFGGSTPEYLVKKLLLIPDSPCHIITNNNTSEALIEDVFESTVEDFQIKSLKIVEDGIGFYVQYWI